MYSINTGRVRKLKRRLNRLRYQAVQERPAFGLRGELSVDMADPPVALPASVVGQFRTGYNNRIVNVFASHCSCLQRPSQNDRGIASRLSRLSGSWGIQHSSSPSVLIRFALWALMQAPTGDCSNSQLWKSVFPTGRKPSARIRARPHFRISTLPQLVDAALERQEVCDVLPSGRRYEERGQEGGPR